MRSTSPNPVLGIKGVSLCAGPFFLFVDLGWPMLGLGRKRADGSWDPLA